MQMKVMIENSDKEFYNFILSKQTYTEKKNKEFLLVYSIKPKSKQKNHNNNHFLTFLFFFKTSLDNSSYSHRQTRNKNKRLN